MMICSQCQKSYPEQGVPTQCPACGGTFDLRQPPVYDPAQVDRSQPGYWRYQHTFALPENAQPVTLGEGNTPLIWGEAFGRQVAFKLEFLNPTGSFKDRGTAVLTSFLLSRGVKAAVEDSSGNAGSSFSAYAAHAGLQAKVFVPAYASGPKRAQIAAYGAEVISVPGARSQAAEAVRNAAEQGAVYASHAYLPLGLLGLATIAYELWEQLDAVPGAVVAPAGQGSLLLGIGLGFIALKNAGLIEKIPQLIGVQARACAPMWAEFQFGKAGLQQVTEGKTWAEGVRVRHPLRSDSLLPLVRQSGGRFVAVEEDAILPGRDRLAQLGLYVEPTSAIVWPALEQTLPELAGPVVAILTGFGLKSFGV